MLNNNHSLTHFPPPILPTPYTYNNITMEAIIKVFIHWLYRMKVLWTTPHPLLHKHTPPYTYNNITMEAIIEVFIRWLYRMKVLWSRWMFNFSLLKHKTNIKQHALHITVKPV
jgi:hypothetical protein